MTVCVFNSMVVNVLSRDAMGSHAKVLTNLDYDLECLQGISDNIPTLASHGMKFIEIFLEVYSISDLPCAQAYSHFLRGTASQC